MDLKTYFTQFNDFDIRVNHDARYVDQKCTPDIVCFIADCILSTSCAKKTFTVNDLWDENYFIQNARVIFGKPSPNNPDARNEYNKVLSQPLKLLAYAHVLEQCGTGKILVFKVQNMEMLEYISVKERNAYNFLLSFFEAVIDACGLDRLFIEYEQECSRDITTARNNIYNRYHAFISANTPSKSKIDCARIFHKVFNVIAYSRQLPGSHGKELTWYDLMYNKVNCRDHGKNKSLTREESASRSVKEANELFYIDYQVNKAIRMIKKMHGDVSEVSDELAQGKATEVHHIFPKSKFPHLGSYLENLILLTSSQHRQKAHMRSDFKTVDIEYQQICLLSKLKTVETFIRNNGETRYTKKSFVYVVNEGLMDDVVTESDSFNDMRRKIYNEYNQASSFLYVAEKKAGYSA